MGYNRSRSSEVISASEIGQYVFCPIAWYLHKQGYQSDSVALVRGEKAHYTLGKQLEVFDHAKHLAKWLIRIGFFVIISGVIGFVGWLVL